MILCKKLSNNNYFSVSPTKKVIFAPGNVWWVKETDTFKFAEHLYDVLQNNNISDNGFDVEVDLFGWSTSSTNYGVSLSSNKNDYAGDFKDWGELFPGYFTLSAEEWLYVIKKRYNASDKIGMGHITIKEGVDYYGIILLPDKIPSFEFKSGIDMNEYTLKLWMELEKSGAIFLPYGGYRFNQNGTSVADDILATNTAHYWTSTTPGSGSANVILSVTSSLPIFDSPCYLTSHDRYIGCNVRLVKDFRRKNVYITDTSPYANYNRNITISGTENHEFVLKGKTSKLLALPPGHYTITSVVDIDSEYITDREKTIELNLIKDVSINDSIIDERLGLVHYFKLNL